MASVLVRVLVCLLGVGISYYAFDVDQKIAGNWKLPRFGTNYAFRKPRSRSYMWLSLTWIFFVQSFLHNCFQFWIRKRFRFHLSHCRRRFSPLSEEQPLWNRQLRSYDPIGAYAKCLCSWSSLDYFSWINCYKVTIDNLLKKLKYFSIFLAYVLVLLKTVCLVCIGTYVINIVILKHNWQSRKEIMAMKYADIEIEQIKKDN